MKTLLAALAAFTLLAVPASAKLSDSSLGPLGDIVWTARTIQLVFTRLDLDHNQRDKVLELMDWSRKEARNIERRSDMGWFRRQERLLDLSNELRGRVIHVLTGRQKDRLEDMLYNDRSGRRSNRTDWPWNY